MQRPIRESIIILFSIDDLYMMYRLQTVHHVVHEPTIEFAAPLGGGYATAINVRILYL